VTDGKPIAVLLQPISGVSAINLFVVFYDIHGGKREVLFFYFVPDTTRDLSVKFRYLFFDSGCVCAHAGPTTVYQLGSAVDWQLVKKAPATKFTVNC
jgi:hypothetical protein